MTLEPRPMPNLTLRFDFDENSPWAGHAVLCRRQVSLAAAVHLQALFATTDEHQQIAAARRFAELFITDWTFSGTGDDGVLRKLPITGETFVEVLDARTAMEVFQRWTEAVGMQVARPLEMTSSAGDWPASMPPPRPAADPAYEPD